MELFLFWGWEKETISTVKRIVDMGMSLDLSLEFFF